MTRVHAPELFEPRRRYRSRERDQYLREHSSVDPAILGEQLGLHESTVRMYQRKLGLRKCANKRYTKPFT